jgi:hypothetical protein
MSVAELPAMLSDEQIEQMSDEEIRAYFERVRQVAARRGIQVAAPKAASTGVNLDSVLSRAAIFARANRAFEAAQTRRNETETAYNERLSAFLTANGLTEVSPEIQEKIDTHVRESLARAESGYAKTSATNKGKRKSNVAEQTQEGGE